MAFVTYEVVEYGTIAVPFAMFGFMRRHRENLKIKVAGYAGFLVVASFAYIAHQSVMMETLSGAQFLVLCAGMVYIGIVLWCFAPRQYPGFRKFAGPVLPLIQVLGRYTLEIYVIHLLFFRGLAMALFPERFMPLNFQIIPPSLKALLTAAGP
jgi:hypothetical protein